MVEKVTRERMEWFAQDLNQGYNLRFPPAVVTRPEISEMDLRDKTWSSSFSGEGISVGASLGQITAHPFIEFN